MFHEISKVLRVFVWPYNLGWLSLLVCLYLLKKDRVVWVKRILWSVVILFYVFSLPIFAYYRTKSIEGAYPSKPIEEYPKSDAIVVLGGSTGQKTFPRFEAEETEGSRLLPAIRLFHQKKANLIIVSGGVPYEGTDGKSRTESSDMKEILLDLGIPESSIIEENKSRNTVENALFVKKILEKKGINEVLLVTSAVHMRRAMMIFEKAGMKAIPVPCLHKATVRDIGVSDFLPDAGALGSANSLIKESFGYLLTSSLPLESFTK